ncbi:hypothetical protein SDC9_91558 [bioreactor metagenome]|uniref:Uncharacterized protein n=1 Tax=bioreactor metagenome TaxID=1076179 RepID=A0A644ZVZ4_9ZZZZ
MQIVGDLQTLLRLGVLQALHMLALQRPRQIKPRVAHLDFQIIVEARNPAHLRAQLTAQQQRHEHRGDGPRDGRQALAAAPNAHRKNEIVNRHNDERQPASGQQQVSWFARAPGMPLELHAIEDEDEHAREPAKFIHCPQMLGGRQQRERTTHQRIGPEQLFQSGHALSAENPGELAEARHIHDEQTDACPRHRQRMRERPAVRCQQGPHVCHPDERHECIPPVGMLAAMDEIDHEEDAAHGTRQHRRDQIGRALAPDVVLDLLAHQLRRADIQIADTGLQLTQPRHAQPQCVHAAMQRGARQQPPARHVPARRQRLHQRHIAP